MAGVESVTVETPGRAAADAFDASAFGPAAPTWALVPPKPKPETPATGFRGLTLSLVVARPSAVDAFVGAALDAGATS